MPTIDSDILGLAAIHVDPEEVRDTVLAEIIDAASKIQTANILRGSFRRVDHLLTKGNLELVRKGALCGAMPHPP